MDSRDRVLRHLKRRGPATVAGVAAALGLSANAARHHLGSLERAGAVRSATPPAEGRGRPARRYELTVAAEEAFPKRYPELLAALLAEAERQGALDALLSGIAERLAASLRPAVIAEAPRERLLGTLRLLDYGDMLPALTIGNAAWRLEAHNCVYREAGCQVVGVCELLPRIVTLATDLAAERVACQRDGLRSCTFAGSLLPG